MDKCLNELKGGGKNILIEAQGNKTQRAAEWNMEGNSGYENIIQKRDRNAKGNPKWNAAGNENFNKYNKKKWVEISEESLINRMHHVQSRNVRR